MKFKINKNKLNQVLGEFEKYSHDERFFADTKERKERVDFFNSIKKSKFDEALFSQAIKKLWASLIFVNKDYLVNKIIDSNGLGKLSKAFELLNNNEMAPEKRYLYFMENIKGMGPAMVTEYLCYIDSQKAGIWNNKARSALSWLEADDIVYNKYKISEEEYRKFNEFANELAGELKTIGLKNPDLLLVDYFLWEIWDKHAKGEVRKTGKNLPSPSANKSRHEELKDKIFQIGSWLGFEPEVEKLISTGAEIDVLWRAKIANLGTISYAFEVQDRGSIDSLLLNLQKAQKNPTVQKLVVVSNLEQIEKIKKELADLPENFRRVVTFWEDLDVDKTHENLEQVSASISKLTLVEE